MSIEFIDLKSQYRSLKPRIQSRMDAVLEHGQYIMGPEVAELEAQLQSFTGAPHCITVASGTEALLISLMALGVGRGDEVITTPFTFVATAEVVALLGATPVFVDIDPRTCNIDPAGIRERITPRTRAIMPVSLYGQPAEMEAINAIAREAGNIPVIEDAAQSFGAMYRGNRSCNLSSIACTSFFPSKPLGCYGDGGAIFTSDSEIAAKCRELRVHGQRERYRHHSVGVGGRMDTLQCAIVLAKLEVFEEEIALRERVAKNYHALIGDSLPGVRLLPWPEADRSSVFAQFTLLVEDREQLRQRLGEAGVPTAVHYPAPIYDQPAYESYGQSSQYPHANRASREVLSLPMHPHLQPAEQEFIVGQLQQACVQGVTADNEQDNG